MDFSYDVDSVEKGIEKVAKGLLQYGVTSFCPTLVTSPDETYHKILPKIRKREGGENGATILGVHLEGPFINPAKKGAHPEECIKKFTNVSEIETLVFLTKRVFFLLLINFFSGLSNPGRYLR